LGAPKPSNRGDGQLQKLDARIAECWLRADEAEQRAALATDEALRERSHLTRRWKSVNSSN
jgi:hypothetical protein